MTYFSRHELLAEHIEHAVRDFAFTDCWKQKRAHSSETFAFPKSTTVWLHCVSVENDLMCFIRPYNCFDMVSLLPNDVIVNYFPDINSRRRLRFACSEGLLQSGQVGL